MALCEACVHCTQKLLSWLIDGFSGFGCIAYHLSFPKILSSALTCDLCYLLKESCMRRFRAFNEESPRREAVLNYLKTHEMSNEPLCLSLYEKSASKLSIWAFSASRAWDLEIWVATGSSLDRRGHINGIPPIRQDDCDKSFDLIRTWFNECRVNHTRCSTTISDYPIDEKFTKLPTRVIDVSPDEDLDHVILIESHGRHGHYAALSHCWGPPSKRPLQTTKETLSQHESGIEIKKLPKTFRDAVVVTREIGIRYLWIDSLCIVQQDKAEWNHEVLRMGEIFEKAQVVIAAATAKDSSEGLFMSGRHLTDPIVKLPCRCDEDNRSEEVMVSFSVPIPQFEKDCLWDRAWTFQEKHLARRMLIFGLKGIFWTCKSTEKILGDRERSYEKWNPLGKNWLKDVEEYCWKGLTYESDRLVAIEGLARELEKTRSDTYEAGIWFSEAHKTLSWIVDGQNLVVPSGSRVLGVLSWSWASVTGSKTFPGERLTYTSAREKATQIHNVRSGERHTLAEITFNGGNDLHVKSYLKSASLSPGCRCLRDMKRLCNQKSHNEFFIFNWQETQALKMRGANADPVGWAYFDEKSVEDFLCLLLYEIEGGMGLLKEGRRTTNQGGVSLYYFALLLKQVTGTESFRRIGLGLITVSSWFDGEPLLSVSIV